MQKTKQNDQNTTSNIGSASARSDAVVAVNNAIHLQDLALRIKHCFPCKTKQAPELRPECTISRHFEIQNRKIFGEGALHPTP